MSHGFTALRRRHHQHADRLARSRSRPGEETLSVAVVCPDRWFPGDVAVVTSRDGHAFASEVAGLDVCTGEVTIKLPGS